MSSKTAQQLPNLHNDMNSTSTKPLSPKLPQCDKPRPGQKPASGRWAVGEGLKPRCAGV